MREITGDIWDFHEQGFPIVITTNCNINSRHNAVMGKGIASEAKEHFPGLPKMLGEHIKCFYDAVKYFPEFNLFVLPTKYNWWEKSDLELIEQGVIQLRKIVHYKQTVMPKVGFDKVYMVRPGCSNGHLKWEDVKPILVNNLDVSFFVVEKRT